MTGCDENAEVKGKGTGLNYVERGPEERIIVVFKDRGALLSKGGEGGGRPGPRKGSLVLIS